MKKTNLIIALAAILLLGVAWALTKSSSPTGAAGSIVSGITGNIVTLIAVLAIAGIVIVTVLKKY